MTPRGDVDVLLVELGSTEGLRVAEEALRDSLRRAGARVAVARAHHPGELRTLMLTDLAWAHAARRAAQELLAEVSGERPPPVIYSTVTAALLWPRPGAIRFDATASANRPGRHGLWQRPVERRRLRQAPLLLPSSAGALAEAAAAVGAGRLDPARTLVLPAPIVAPEHSEGGAERDIAAITYAANPRKKGFDRVLEAWKRVRRPGERLVVAGVTAESLRQSGLAVPGEGVDVVGPLPREEYRALLRRSRVFVCAPRREDYGLAQLEALAEGCHLVTTPAPGAYVALPLAHKLDARLVGEDLGSALRAALDTPAADYASRAAGLVEPFTTQAVDRVVAEELLPRLLASG